MTIKILHKQCHSKRSIAKQLGVSRNTVNKHLSKEADENPAINTNYDWHSMFEANRLLASMSRKGNCHDNACSESFFGLLKRERIR